MAEPMSTAPPSRADRWRPRPSSASWTGSATVPSRRFWSAWWIRPCLISGSCVCWPTRLPRRKRREGKSDARDSGGVGVALRDPRRCRVGWPESLSYTKSSPADDLLVDGAADVAVDAALDAVDHGDPHPGSGTGAGGV